MSTRLEDAWQQPRNFSYLDLVDATNRFSSENLIYRGENELVFYGILRGIKLKVIVKVQHDMKKYTSEMQALEKTRNENVIMLLGTCLEETARLLVFEYACNGSLDQHLSRKIVVFRVCVHLLFVFTCWFLKGWLHDITEKNSRPLAWQERIKIAIGACRGLYYLHENKIIHGDMRPRNIWLACDFEPLVSHQSFLV